MQVQRERIPVGVLSVMDGDTLDVVDWMRGRGSYSVEVRPWEYRYAAGGRVKPEYPAWGYLEGLGLSWLLVLLPVVIVVLLFILFSELR